MCILTLARCLCYVVLPCLIFCNQITVTVTTLVTLQHIAQGTPSHCQQLSSLYDLPSTRLVLCSIHTVWHTSLSFLNTLSVDSGDVSLHAVLIHCPAMLQMVFLHFLLVLMGCTLYRWCNQCWNGLTATSKTWNWEVMPPGVIFTSEGESDH